MNISRTYKLLYDLSLLASTVLLLPVTVA